MSNFQCELTELKFASSPTKDMTFEGYGAVFGNVDLHGDVIARGAFSAFLDDVKSGIQSWPVMLSQHGANAGTTADMTPVGAWIDMQEDAYGLKLSGQLADTPRGQELYQLLKMSPRPGISGLSIGFILKDFERLANGGRKIKQVDLIEVSLVTMPANTLARVVSVKAGPREIERMLCSNGYSRSEARAFLRDGLKAITTETDHLDLLHALQERGRAIA